MFVSVTMQPGDRFRIREGATGEFAVHRGEEYEIVAAGPLSMTIRWVDGRGLQDVYRSDLSRASELVGPIPTDGYVLR
jgi:hypothetical protein